MEENKKFEEIKKTLYQNKALLNQVGFHGTAALSVYLKARQYREDTPIEINGSLSISDCNNVIHLDLNAYNDEAFDNVLYKLTVLAENATILKQVLEDYKEEFVAAYNKSEKIQKQREKEGIAERARFGAIPTKPYPTSNNVLNTIQDVEA